MKNYFNTFRLDDKVVFEKDDQYWDGVVVGVITHPNIGKELKIKATPFVGGEQTKFEFFDSEEYSTLVPFDKLDDFLPKSTVNLIRKIITI